MLILIADPLNNLLQLRSAASKGQRFKLDPTASYGDDDDDFVVNDELLDEGEDDVEYVGEQRTGVCFWWVHSEENYYVVIIKKFTTLSYEVEESGVRVNWEINTPDPVKISALDKLKLPEDFCKRFFTQNHTKRSSSVLISTPEKLVTINKFILKGEDESFYYTQIPKLTKLAYFLTTDCPNLL